MKVKRTNKIIAWIILIISIISALGLSYLKFIPNNNENIQENPINESSSNAIHTALKNITTNFNQDNSLKEYTSENNIQIKAEINNYSIFISYIDSETITYEFTYDELCLNIVTNEKEEDFEKFKIIYKFLISAVQTRLNNTNNIENTINEFLNNSTNYDGLTKIKTEDGTKYQMNITKKLK